jgi:ABC-type multidrug transport system fused ATPase/permease subunit
MSVEGALMYLVIGRMMITPTLRFINLYTSILIVSSTYKKIEYYQNLPNQIIDGQSEKISFKKFIKIKNVKFSYNDIDYFDFDDLIINKGDKIGLIGINGSGKTTLIDLILRLIYPNSGEITLDDKKINEFKIKSFHSLFGVVPQDPYLFNDTIKNNIVFGRQNITEDQINNSLILSNSTSLVGKKLSGLDYIIGEKGANLSGGEKQKIAISRALLTDPQIIIFDEAMSSVDSKNTKFINENFNEIFKDKTMIVIGHSLTSLSMCNKFVKINQGKIDLIEASNDESVKEEIIRKMLSK